MAAILFVGLYVAVPFAIVWFLIRRRRGAKRVIGALALGAYAAVFLVIGPILATAGVHGTVHPPVVNLASPAPSSSGH